MLKILWTAKCTNASIIKELGIQERLATTVRKRVLKFFGRVIRQDDIETLTIQRKIERMRGRGRSPTLYTDQVRKFMGRNEMVKDISYVMLPVNLIFITKLHCMMGNNEDKSLLFRDTASIFLNTNEEK